MRSIFSNKKAAFGYDILDKLEVGIVLRGWEVKSAKAGRFDVSGAFIHLNPEGELLLKGARIPKWDTGEKVTKDEQFRDRKLLARRTQSLKLGGLASRPGYTLIPLDGYVNDRGLIKLTIALVKGKKKFEKKQKIKERDLERQMRRDIKKYL